MLRTIWITFVIIITVSMVNTTAYAKTGIQPLVLEASDGNRITGFLFQDVKTEKDAPLAILMHGMTGSSLHWLAKDNVTRGDDIANDLVKRGYRVVALDARSHGARKDEMNPVKRLQNLRSGQSGPYLAMINGTMDDYDILLAKMKSKFGQPRHILALGYSMGAQMSVLFAAKHKDVSHIVTMVPPAAKSAPIVAPVNHAHKVQAEWLLLTASRDQFSSPEDNDALISAAGDNLHRIEYDSRHMLPRGYVDAVIEWIAKIGSETAADK